MSPRNEPRSPDPASARSFTRITLASVWRGDRHAAANDRLGRGHRRAPAEADQRDRTLRCAVSGHCRGGAPVGANAVGLIDVGCSAGLNLNVDRVGITYSNGQSLGDPSSPGAASVTWPESAAVSDASAAIRCLAVPRLCRRSTLATPEADRSKPRSFRCRNRDFGPASSGRPPRPRSPRPPHSTSRWAGAACAVPRAATPRGRTARPSPATRRRSLRETPNTRQPSVTLPISAA